MELGRVSNLPTVISNTTAGFYLGGGNIFSNPGGWFCALLISACFYEAGMFLNDLCDFEEDRRDRPNRPLPSGRISRTQVASTIVSLFLVGLILSIFFLPSVLKFLGVLFVLILVYNLTHSRFILSPLLMGGCRGLIYLIAATAAGWDASDQKIWIFSAGLAFYVAAVSFIARDELKASLTWVQYLSSISVFAVLLLPVALSQPMGPLGLPLQILAFIPDQPPEHSLTLISALIPAAYWFLSTSAQLILRKIPLPKGVGRMLAGMSLWDALVLGSKQSFSGVLIAWTCFLGARIWQRRIQST